MADEIQAPPRENPFESPHTMRLIIRFAIPCVIAFLVNAVYNIVDQIFIGQIVGFLGNAATNVAFPLVTFSVAGGVLIGDGCAANMSLKMGAGQRDAVAQIFGNSLVLSAVVSICYSIFCIIQMQPLLVGFGATDSVMPYAEEYTSILIYGLPPSMISMMLNAAIRADGNPRYAMLAMIAGALLNIGLDAWFMYGFGWGVTGAATATIIGQYVSFALNLAYIPKMTQFKFRRKNLGLHWRYLGRSLALGTSSFISQIAIAFVQIVMNNMIVIYGGRSIYGTDIPLSAFGIVMKVNMILIGAILGFAVGAQPIWGYNYGARKYRQVKKIYLYTVAICSCLAVAGWIMFQTSPQTIIDWFGQEDEMYNEFAQRCFQTFLFGVICAGFQITSGIFFQAIGMPVRSVLLSLSRQTLFLIPLMILLPQKYGIDGLLYSGPIADFAAAIFAAILIILEMIQLSRLEHGQGKGSGSDAPMSAAAQGG